MRRLKRPTQLSRIDVRIPFAGLLLLYVVLGLTWLGFNRSPGQAVLTVLVTTGVDFALNLWLRRQKAAFPWSGFITGLGLCLLLNYGSHPWLPILPGFLAIASKHIFTVAGRHVFNPTLFGLVVGGLVSGGLISPAPAYQWHGSVALVLVFVALAFFVFVFRIGRGVLILAFLGFYAIQMLVRAYLMRHHVPPEAIIFGTLTSPPFFLFTFYMLTDPMTSPKSWKAQIALAGAVTILDFILHFRQSYSTLFPALFFIQTGLLLVGWMRQFADKPGMIRQSLGLWAKRGGLMLLVGLGLVVLLTGSSHEGRETNGLRFTRISSEESGLTGEMSTILEEVDPRLRHISKWILSVGDAVAVADVDGDGLRDIFLTQPLKRPQDRCGLYRNLGDFRFERVETPAFQVFRENPATNGLPSVGVFADYDNDGDQDLFVGAGFGPSRLFRNDGNLEFADVTHEAGLGAHSTSLAALFVDFDRDGWLDLIVGNAMKTHLDGYANKPPLNIFDLPEPEYEDDRRMLHIMHASWHQAENGGLNHIYRNSGDGAFQRLDAAELGMPQTHWTLALNAADFDRDGWPDIYAASDFGPDDVYFNQGGNRFERREGRAFGSIGKDTYKGMNCSIADFDRNGWQDVYVSNVHAPLQAEGSLLWMLYPGESGPRFRNQAAKRGALNAHRFGWGAGVADLDLNGWPDIVQANGMVDDTPDRRFDAPRDYWYVNSRLARTGPEIHAFADKWADIRGYSIWGKERNRVLLNERGDFLDVAALVGLDERTNSRGVALADFDNDGDADLLVTHQFREPSLFRNDLHRAGKSWIGLEIDGGGGLNRDAANVRVEVSWDGQRQTAEVSNVSGFSAQNDRRLVFGLGGWEGKVGIEAGGKTFQLESGKYHRITVKLARD